MSTQPISLQKQYSSMMVLPRLRGCCDSCTRSKLKCSGERPACQRCRIRRQDCVYSKARRAGRPRLKYKANKPSAPIDREAKSDIASNGNLATNGLGRSDTELSMQLLQEPALSSADSQLITPLIQDTWGQRPLISCELAQTSNASDLDLMLQDMLWSSTEGLTSASSWSPELERNRDNADLSEALVDALLEHGENIEGTLSIDSTSPSSLYTNTIEITKGSSSQPTEIDIEINAIMASITDIATRSVGSNHRREDLCISSWPQLLSKAQLLMYLTASENPSPFRLDAVLHVSWTAEQIKKRISRCLTCMSRGAELSSMLALLYDWISTRIAYALEDPSIIQSCRLMIGNTDLTGSKGIIGIYELVKYRIHRAMDVIENIKSGEIGIRQRGPDSIYKAAELMIQEAASRLEALSGMIDLLESEQSWYT
ncbi:hypothetical protein FBEOM_8836 [Fusarium beomiforme]|uniref:Zn(2)-C6 fungal-type domain-containing protein n=1 Tax=Fusarium beomiforme TaxID=44412 RepID=A0A9P5AEK3_9HYPO|nr:hypothetical protein FBEOM_8836 [Fusarium beomiforme]